VTRHRIDWSLVGRAVAHYESAGFKYVEVPWIVHNSTVNATLPEGKEPFLINRPWSDMHAYTPTLVGSAEQGFLQMMLDGKLGPGRYVTASPCFRDDEVDELHHKDFFKVELCTVLNHMAPYEYVRSLAVEADAFFRSVFRRAGTLPAEHLQMVETAIGLDIELGGIEIGSYGARYYEGHHWVYGTGLAEPRFSQAMAKLVR
jgi:hypothetical protein